MFAKIMKDLLSDDAGYMVSSELILLSTVGILGTAVGFNFLQADDNETEKRETRREARQRDQENDNERRRNTASRSVDRELRDVGNAIGRINQSYYYHGASGFRGANGIPKAATAGSFFIDYEKEAASEEERVERREAERRMFGHYEHEFDYGHHHHGGRMDGFRSGWSYFHRGGHFRHHGHDHKGHARDDHGPHEKGHDHDMKHDHKHGDGHKDGHKAKDGDAKKHDAHHKHGEHHKDDHHKDAGRRHGHGPHGPGPHRQGHAGGRDFAHHGHAWGGFSTAAWNRAYAAGRRAALGFGYGVAGRFGFGAAYDDFCGGSDGYGCGAGFGYGHRFGYGLGGGIRTGLPEGYNGFGYGAGFGYGSGFGLSYGRAGIYGAGGSSYRRVVFRSVRPVCQVAAMQAQAAAADAIIARMNEPKIFKCTDDCVPPAPAGRTFIVPEAINPPLYYLPSFDYPDPAVVPLRANCCW